MKKKILISILAITMLLLCTGCGNNKSEKINTSEKIGGIFADTFKNYTVLEQRDNREYLVYDNDTCVLYILTLQHTGSLNYNYSLCPYYVMNENNEPVVGVYNGDEMWEEYKTN